jgi:hypothetical protein
VTVRLSCALPPSVAIAEQARHAEQLGYHRVWVFESSALHGDPWVALPRAAAATERVGLGTGIAVAGLRHPMVTAAAAASVAETAPGRHLDIHQGHLTTLTPRGRDLAAAAGPALLRLGWTGASMRPGRSITGRRAHRVPRALAFRTGNGPLARAASHWHSILYQSIQHTASLNIDEESR